MIHGRIIVWMNCTGFSKGEIYDGNGSDWNRMTMKKIATRPMKKDGSE